MTATNVNEFTERFADYRNNSGLLSATHDCDPGLRSPGQ